MTAEKKITLANEQRLASFLEKYKRSRGIGSKSYAAYLRTRGTDPATAYTDALGTAHRNHARADARYGTEGEQLARAGGADGYAAYLTQAADNVLKRDQRAAQAQHTATHIENERGYTAYLEDRATTLRNTINSMRSQGIRRYNDAYAYTLTAGFDSDTAYLAADLIEGMEAKPASVMEKSARQKLLTEMIRLNLPRDAAYLYALSCGMDDEIAALLADACTGAQANQNQLY